MPKQEVRRGGEKGGAWSAGTVDVGWGTTVQKGGERERKLGGTGNEEKGSSRGGGVARRGPPLKTVGRWFCRQLGDEKRKE